jgi:septum formation protein
VHVRLYLASTSPARLATLRAAGIEPIVLPSEVDEDAAVAAASLEAPLTAPAMVELLARLKAQAVVGRLVDGEPIDGFILGGDSAFELDGVIYGKPHLPEVARERWLLHRRGVVGDASGLVSTSAVTFADNISDAEIDAYIATGEPLKVAGAFTIDSLGAPFVAAVDGDPHAVVGLSLAVVRQLLLEFDVSWPSLWNRRPL